MWEWECQERVDLKEDGEVSSVHVVFDFGHGEF